MNHKKRAHPTETRGFIVYSIAKKRGPFFKKSNGPRIVSRVWLLYC
jgi:hypothetical protein